MRTAPYRLPQLFLLLAFVAGALVLSSCGGDSDPPSDPGGVFNRPPTVSEIEWGNPYVTYIGGDVLDLKVTASDPDGDPLSYHWSWASAEQGGSFSSDSTETTILTVGSTPGQYQAQVSVSDGRSNPITRVVGFSVGNALAGGDVSVNTTWTASNWPYVLAQDTTVRNGITLTIQGGVEVQLRRRKSGPGEFNITLRVEAGGRLVAAGSSGAPVVLRGNAIGSDANRSHDGLEVDHLGEVELRHTRILQAITGLMKRGSGSALLEDLTISDCAAGYLGLQHGTAGPASSVTMTRVTVSSCGADGISLNNSTGNFERVWVKSSGAVGLKLTSSSATLRRCELDSNVGGNLRMDRNSTVDLSCCNLLPAMSGYNVVFPADGGPVSGLLPMTNSYWGVSSPTSEEQIRDQTFDPAGRIDGSIWRRETDLDGYRSGAINFDDGGDPCNQ